MEHTQMSNEIMSLDNMNYDAMAKAMGMANEASSSDKKSTLSRLRIHHSPVMGQEMIKNKMMNVEVVPGGMYKLEGGDGSIYYASEVKIRPYMQRFMYKRFIKGNEQRPNSYTKSVMNDNLNVDLKDTAGTFNCGKPAGYITDFKALPEKMQDLIKQIKRVRAIFGVVEMVDPVDASGNPAVVPPTPFIWEIDNRDAFKIVGEVFTRLAKHRRLPLQHYFTAKTDPQTLPNGNVFYLPVVTVDLLNSLEVTDTEKNNFVDFMAWVTNYNTYVTNAWNDNALKDDSDVDVDTVNDFIDIDMEDVA
jgi:hypothetical protein